MDRKETIWLITATLFWGIVLAPLEIKIESDAGLAPKSMAITASVLFLWGVVVGLFFQWRFHITFVESRYRTLLIFIYAFFVVLLSPIARALLIAKYGR